jgi:Large ribosomal RNA subunit accumulation protein YceD
MADNMDRRVWSVPVKLGEVPEGGLHVELEAPPEVCAAIADLAGLRGVSDLRASFDVTRRGAGLRVTGQVRAEVGQTCVVTLEPVETTVDEDIDLSFLPGAPEPHAEGDAENAPEPLVDDRIDLGAIAIEFLVVGIDPYPRKPGVAFEPPPADSTGAHPFAALAALKKDKT